MKQKMLDQMAAVTAAQYMQEHAKVQPILARAAQLRGQLAQLNAQVQSVREQGDGDHAMKALGADLLWQGWHTRTRRQLNQDLAKATAQKLRVMDQLRQAFGRKHAVETMAASERKRRKAEQAKSFMDQLLGQ
jgi:predicted  nucleic acid-binding Zn-ribbon protein